MGDMTGRPQAVPRLKLAWHGRTVVGKVRTNNEDTLWAHVAAGGQGDAGDSEGQATLDGSGVLLAVADGIGGALAGEVASGMAAVTLGAELAAHVEQVGEGEHGAESSTDALVAAVNAANRRIRDEGESNPQRRGMGTTLTTAWCHGTRAVIAQIGDSRLYLFRGGHLTQLTKDQSLVGKLIEDGILTEEEAERIAGKNIILQALGSEDTLDVVHQIADLEAGDMLLLCTDGLSGVVTNPDIEGRLRRGGDLARVVTDLIQAAEDRGGPDNITVLLGRVDKD